MNDLRRVLNEQDPAIDDYALVTIVDRRKPTYEVGWKLLLAIPGGRPPFGDRAHGLTQIIRFLMHAGRAAGFPVIYERTSNAPGTDWSDDE